MKVTFVSNYFNHHQRALSDALFHAVDDAFAFVETSPMRLERRQMGYGRESRPSYVCTAYTSGNPEEIYARVADADVVIFGSAQERYLRQRKRRGQLIFRYSEHPLKQGAEPLKYLPRYVRWHRKNPANRPIYLLAASAFAPGDYAKFGLFRDRAYRWGYFPETRTYADPDAFLRQKDPTEILWVGRFLELKHPEAALSAAQRLRRSGCSFRLHIIGTGPMEPQLRQRIHAYGLCDSVRLLGAMPPERVRAHMEHAGIFLFTSDRREGWGAVVNEAMNSGCAVVASDAAGAVPYLIEHGKNGLVYPSGNADAMYALVKRLLEEPERQRRLGNAAYHTITELWNAEVAAARLLQLSQAIRNGDAFPDLFESGPCSRAEPICEDWFVT